MLSLVNGSARNLCYFLLALATVFLPLMTWAQQEVHGIHNSQTAIFKHVISPVGMTSVENKINAWADRFLTQILKNQEIPQEWANLTKGIWLEALPQSDLSKINLDHQPSSSAMTNNNLNEDVVVYLKLKPKARWYSADPMLETLEEWREWKSSVQNLEKKNIIADGLLEWLQSARKVFGVDGTAYHSAFYKERGFAGYYRGDYYVVTNPELIEELVLLVPGKYLKDGISKTFHLKKSIGSCRRVHHF